MKTKAIIRSLDEGVENVGESAPSFKYSGKIIFTDDNYRPDFPDLHLILIFPSHTSKENLFCGDYIYNRFGIKT